MIILFSFYLSFSSKLVTWRSCGGRMKLLVGEVVTLPFFSCPTSWCTLFLSPSPSFSFFLLLFKERRFLFAWWWWREKDGRFFILVYVDSLSLISSLFLSLCLDYSFTISFLLFRCLKERITLDEWGTRNIFSLIHFSFFLPLLFPFILSSSFSASLFLLPLSLKLKGREMMSWSELEDLSPNLNLKFPFLLFFISFSWMKIARESISQKDTSLLFLSSFSLLSSLSPFL